MKRMVSAVVAAIAVAAASSCAEHREPFSGDTLSAEEHNYRKTRADAAPFDEARQYCWREGMGSAAASTPSKRRAVENCMNEKGWENPALLK